MKIDSSSVVSPLRTVTSQWSVAGGRVARPRYSEPRGAAAVAEEARVRADAVLDDRIRRDDGPYLAAPPRNVLLTGATGFVGRQVLAALLRRTDARVYCLVRARGVEAAGRRLAPVRREFGDRVVAVPGDLAERGFGLGSTPFRRLSSDVDTIVHSASLAAPGAGYSAMRPVNVGGVVELLRLASVGRPKRLVHLSTSGIRQAAPGAPLAGAGPGGSEAIIPADGYHRSRWVAERLVNHAREQGIPSTVVRLGGVMAVSDTGEGDEGAPLTLLLRTCAEIGLRIVGPAVTDWTPIDTASRLLADALARDVLPQGTLHVVRPGIVRLDEVLDRLERSVPLRRVDYATFWAAVAVQAASDDGAARLLALLPTPHEARPERLPRLFGDAHGLRVATGGITLIARLGMTWPDVDGAALDAHVRWALASSGR